MDLQLTCYPMDAAKKPGMDSLLDLIESKSGDNYIFTTRYVHPGNTDINNNKR